MTKLKRFGRVMAAVVLVDGSLVLAAGLGTLARPEVAPLVSVLGFVGFWWAYGLAFGLKVEVQRLRRSA